MNSEQLERAAMAQAQDRADREGEPMRVYTNEIGGATTMYVRSEGEGPPPAHKGRAAELLSTVEPGYHGPEHDGGNVDPETRADVRREQEQVRRRGLFQVASALDAIEQGPQLGDDVYIVPGVDDHRGGVSWSIGWIEGGRMRFVQQSHDSEADAIEVARSVGWTVMRSRRPTGTNVRVDLQRGRGRAGT